MRTLVDRIDLAFDIVTAVKEKVFEGLGADFLEVLQNKGYPILAVTPSAKESAITMLFDCTDLDVTNTGQFTYKLFADLELTDPSDPIDPLECLYEWGSCFEETRGEVTVRLETIFGMNLGA